MKFPLDQSTDARLLPFLKHLGHDVTRIGSHYPPDLSDHEVLSLARKKQRILITDDRDFGELVFREKLPHAGVIFLLLIPHHSEQLEMFASRSHAVAEAMDRINDKYGEFVITPALMMGMDDTIIDRIAFGGVKELEELYQQ